MTSARRPFDALHRILLLAGACWLLVVVVVALRLPGYALDDFFITYRYAAHLADGEGFVFNQGERVFGTTAPGLGLLLAALSRATSVTIPWLGTVVTALSLWGLALLLLADGRTADQLPERLLAGTLLVSSSLLWLCRGGEAPLTLALLLAAAATGSARRPLLAGGLGGLAVWCRPDAGLGMALLGLVLWRSRRRLPWRFSLAGGLVIAAGLAAAWFWFGRLLPVTLAAKRLQAAWRPEVWPGGWHFWEAAVSQTARFWTGPGTLTLVVLGLVGQWVMLRRRGPATRLLALYALALMVAYPLLGVAFYIWYAVPVALSLLYGATLAIGAAARAVIRFFPAQPVGGWVAAALVLVAVQPWLPVLGYGSWRLVTAPPPDPPRHRLYRQVGEWLRETTSPQASVACVEVGTIGYFSDRRIVDLLGLVTPQLQPYVAHHDLRQAVRDLQPDFFVRYTPADALLASILEDPLFARRYRLVGRWSVPADDRAVEVYERRRGRALPVPRSGEYNPRSQ